MPELNNKNVASQRLLVSAAVLVVALTFSGMTDAQAANRFERQGKTYSASISIADLDLSKPEDIDRLERRLQKKARYFCRTFNSVTATQAMLRKCQQEIVKENRSNIEKAIGSPAA